MSTGIDQQCTVKMATPLDFIAYGRFAWGAASSTWKFFQRKKRNLTPQEKLGLRTKWKPPFERYLADRQRRKLRLDIIIRDMKRMDKYPNTEEGKGISPWFRVGLVGTYEKGFMAGLGWETLIEDNQYGELRYPNRQKGEKGNINLMLTGYIPYENVESVDWDGDGYYSFPHIYCYFDFKGQPYERLAFCEKRNLDEQVYFSDVVDCRSVEKLSKKRGVKR